MKGRAAGRESGRSVSGVLRTAAGFPGGTERHDLPLKGLRQRVDFGDWRWREML